MAADKVTQKVLDYLADKPHAQYAKGETILTPGEGSEQVFFLAEGRIKAHEVSYRGDEVVVSLIQSPAFFPLSWAINHVPNRFYYKADKDSLVYKAGKDEILDFIEKNPDVMFNQLSRVYASYDGMLGRLVQMMAGTAKTRLLYELIIECRRFGSQQPDGSCRLDATERDLAARAGLTRETVSREMSKLKRQDWVTVNGKGIFIHDTAQLERALGADV
jgi:CRP/FNR family transcriptional regulator